MATQFGDYESALRFLFSQTDYEKMQKVSYNRTTFNLERARWLMRLLGDPQRRVRTIHIAGTKGKGSTAAMLAAMLAGSGLKVGLYSSPHLEDIRERIRVGNRLISKRRLTALVNRVTEALKVMRPVNPPTFFEIFTALAWLHFEDEKVDAAIMETGMGGRLDSTTVCEPTVCLVSRIGIDHTKQLGETLGEIAIEKAGIFKRGVPVVASPQAAEAAEALRGRAAEVGCRIDIIGEDLPIAVRPVRSRGRLRWELRLLDGDADSGPVRVPLLGRFQADNCALALAAANRLVRAGWKLDCAAMLRGLAKTRWPGRLEVVSRRPMIVLDGAHNGESLACALDAAGAHFAFDRLICVFAMGADKRVDDMLAVLADGADRVIFTAADSPRAERPAALARRFREVHGGTSRTARTCALALALARRTAKPGDLILITGSLYLVGEARTFLRESHP